jgi:outer membrane receptor protein involved in Fe transport
VKGALAGTVAEYGLTRLPEDSSTAIVVSNGNAGDVDEWGIELGATISVGRGVSVGGSYTFFDFTINKQEAGDVLEPNTPRHKGTISLAYSGGNGVDLGLDVRLVGGYPWAVGVFRGYVPGSQILNLSAGYRLTPNLRVHAIGTNILDQQRFQMFGGSVNGRRVLAGVTTTL